MKRALCLTVSPQQDSYWGYQLYSSTSYLLVILSLTYPVAMTFLFSFSNDTGYYVLSPAYDFLPCSAVSQLVLALSLLSTSSSCMCMVLGGSCQSRKQFSLCSGKVSLTFEPKLLTLLLRTLARILCFMLSVAFPHFPPPPPAHQQ